MKRTITKNSVVLICLLILGVTVIAQVKPEVAISENTTNIPLTATLRAEVEAALKKRDFKAAETLLVNEINQQKNSGEAAKLLIFTAGIFFLDSDWLNAAICYKKAEKISPLDVRSRFTLAMVYLKLNQASWAIPELTQLAKEQPENALYIYWLGRIDYDAQKYDQAVIKLRRAVELDPKMMRAHDNLGLTYEHLSDNEAAAKSYRAAIELNRKQTNPSPWPNLNLVILLMGKNELDEAENLLREALRYDAKLPQIHYNLGQILEKQNKPIEAKEALLQAIVLDQNYAEPHYTLSRIYQKQSEKIKAKEELDLFQKLKKR
jgi:tetratricopeptide (TPR) repeat protein